MSNKITLERFVWLLLKRKKSPFIVATIGGMVALIGDFVWLLNDSVFHGLLHWNPYPFYMVIASLFSFAFYLAYVAIKLYMANGYLMKEVHDEHEYKISERNKGRFSTVAPPMKVKG